MDDPLTAIANIGPATAAALVKAGVPTASALRAMGADAAYRALLASGQAPHFIGYYVLHMALQGRPWNDCKGDEKAALRERFDAIRATARPDFDVELERVLDEIGVRPATRTGH